MESAIRWNADRGAKRNGLTSRLILLGAGSVLIAVLSLVGIAVRLSASYTALAQEKVNELILQDLDHITNGAYNLVRAEGESYFGELSRSLGVAHAFLDVAGGVSFNKNKVSWLAMNQFNSKSIAVELPQMLVGGEWLGVNADPGVPSPFVDKTAVLLGITATLFQRMNEQGDMLRVSTTVPNRDGTRAIGTYIPAIMPDGSRNPVIAAVLDGRMYSGRAVVVDDWFLTAYEPIRSPDGSVAGMLYVGQRQSTIESRIRSAIINTRIGKTGYVYVITGKGENRGRYVISQGGARDGERIWDTVDSDGRFVIQDIIETATKLNPGELASIRYRWQNPGESEPRWKIARLAYYAPWDWVIGTSAYEDEFNEYRRSLEAGRSRMSLYMVIAGFAIMISVGATAVLVANGIARPLVALAGSARAYTQGEAWQPVAADSYEVVSDLASAFDAMAERIKDTLRVLSESEERYRSVYENALEGIFKFNFDGTILDANPAMANILGYDNARVLIDKIKRIGVRLLADGDEFGALLSDIRSRGVSMGREFLVYKADGSTIWLSVNAWRVRSASGPGFDIDCLATDIDARKRSEMQLRATLEQKELLLREVHHRVKNNLQILVSLLELEETQAHAAKELAILGEFSSRILAMGKIHGLVYTSRDLNSVDMMAYADSILAELHAKYHGCFGKVEWRIEGDRLLLNLDQAIPCGLMLREILSNSLRHAFPTPRVSSGAILVRFGTSADGRTELTISDDGIGLPHGFETSASDGLGIMLIHSLASQLHAEISFDGSAGCRYTVMFPSEPLGPGPGVRDTT